MASDLEEFGSGMEPGHELSASDFEARESEPCLEERRSVDPGPELPSLGEQDDLSGYVPSDVDAESAEVRWYKKAGEVNSDESFAVVGQPERGAQSFASRVQPSSSEDFRGIAAMVDAAYMQIPTKEVKHFWESGFWGNLFGTAPPPMSSCFTENLERPVLISLGDENRDVSSSSAPRKQYVPKQSSFLQAVRNREPISWKEKRAEQMREALALWQDFVISWPSNISVVRQLSSLQDDLRPRMIKDLLGHKAPSTLLKRYRSLLAYFEFLRDNGVPFPGAEPDCYGFLCLLQDEGRPASARKGVLEALAFARFVLGVHEIGTINESRRCHGNAKAPARKDHKQADALKVAEMQRLHRVLELDESAWNRVFAGCSLMGAKGRARWEDLMHTEKIIWDENDRGILTFIECSVDVHKTAHARQMKGVLLPVVAPAIGVTESNWGALWRQARQALGIKDPQDGGVMMPAPDADMGVTDRSLESDEAGAWLRLLLYGSISKLDMRRISSHSLKCTCISYATKFGASPDEILLLGYHCSGHQMAITYGRDSASPSVLLLERVLKAIRDGRFRPDETRSGRFVNLAAQEVVLVKDEPGVSKEHLEAPATCEPAPKKVSPQVHEGSSPATTSSESSSSAGSSADRKGSVSFMRALVPEPAEGMVYWEHKRSKILHLTYAHYSKIFVCGRIIGPLHVKVQGAPGPACSRCTTCAKVVAERG